MQNNIIKRKIEFSTVTIDDKGQELTVKHVVSDEDIENISSDLLLTTNVPMINKFILSENGVSGNEISLGDTTVNCFTVSILNFPQEELVNMKIEPFIKQIPQNDEEAEIIINDENIAEGDEDIDIDIDTPLDEEEPDGEIIFNAEPTEEEIIEMEEEYNSSYQYDDIEEPEQDDSIDFGIEDDSNLPLGDDEMPEDTESLVDPPWEPLGTFFVDNITIDNDGKTKTLICYDKFNQLNIPYKYSTTIVGNLTATMVYIDLKVQLADYGLTIEDGIVFPDVKITLDNNYTIKDMIGFLAGLVGCIASINRDNMISFYDYEEANTTIENNCISEFKKNLDGNITIESIECNKDITGVNDKILATNDGIAISYKNPYMTLDILNENILPKYQNMRYTPCTLVCEFDSSYQIGDILTVYTDDEIKLLEQYKAELTNTTSEEITTQLNGVINQIGSKVIIMRQTIDFLGTSAKTTIECLGSTVLAKETTISPIMSTIRYIYQDLTNAIAHATETIVGQKGGYVIMNDSDGDGHPDEILIMDKPDIETATKVWRWNNAGLGFCSDPNGKAYYGEGTGYKLAMTNDGQIVADMITTGKLNTAVLNVSSIIQAINEDNETQISFSKIFMDDESMSNIVMQVSGGLKVGVTNYLLNTAYPCEISSFEPAKLYYLSDEFIGGDCILSFAFICETESTTYGNLKLSLVDESNNTSKVLGTIALSGASIGELRLNLSENITYGNCYIEGTLKNSEINKIIISDMQLERGDLLTDWKPCNKDLVNTTEFKQTYNEISLNFGNLSQNVNSNNQSLKEIYSNIKFFNETRNGKTQPVIYLGKNSSDSDLALKLGSDEINFVSGYDIGGHGTDMTNEVIPARITRNALILDDTSNSNYIQFGTFGFFPTDDNHITFCRIRQ
ncbi:hypothetical protein [Anaerofustis stercorihominis]|uniref:hypothetical protein n=1 Tax=Anaerofustis stercorihominis TaxID=214853 RepID=UPI00214B73CE|nr:hypothetical protein [Anaerofustis stercorihominis]MCR2033720.1 hypothetical protein [Anaerofustis stercorihominis]